MTQNTTVPNSDEEWKAKLDPETYHVTREKGTEAPFTNKYWNEDSKGVYHCSNCDLPLFSSETKYVTNIPGLKGWPSFEDAIPGSVKFVDDNTMGMHRTEIVCSRCDSHLGHVFDEHTETKTGQHYCINSCALDLKQSE